MIQTARNVKRERSRSAVVAPCTLYLSLFTLLLSACQASTNRPIFYPVTGASTAVIRMSGERALATLVEQLRADSVPISRVETRDGYAESPWFDSATGQATGRRPLGTDVVRVRAWVDPEKPQYSRLTVESVYRQVADPSLPPRELDQQLPPTHPVAARVQTVLDSLVARYGDPDQRR